MTISVSDAREGLSRALRAFRDGDGAEPIFFGAHRKPEGVILSFAQFQGLVEASMLLEDLGDIALIRDRLRADVETAEVTDFDTVAKNLGLADELDY